MFGCSKWNYGSKFYIRTLHILLSITVPTTLLFTDNELHEHMWKASGLRDVLYFVSYLLLLLLSVIFYCITFLTDPGFVPLKSSQTMSEAQVCQIEENESDGDADTDMMLAPSSGIKLRHCTECNIQQPMRSHHCEDCKRCVRKFDHHCPWFETCIGEGNHNYFLVFIVLKTPLVLWSAVLTWRAVKHHADWTIWLEANVFFVVDLFILIPAGFSLVCLFFMHSYFAITNTTTWEMMSRERITYLKNLDDDKNPFHLGYCKNIYRFLCWKSAIRWESIYSRFSKDSEVQ